MSYPENSSGFVRKGSRSTIKRSFDLNSSINYRLFSDVAALTGSPNGLIQNEFDLLLNTQIVKRKKKIEPKAKNFILAHRVSNFLETSKFDSQFDTAKTEEITKNLARS